MRMPSEGFFVVSANRVSLGHNLPRPTRVTLMFFDMFPAVEAPDRGLCGLHLADRISCGSVAKRTLARLNAFDFIVTVAFGSTLATVALSNSVA